MEGFPGEPLSVQGRTKVQRAAAPGLLGSSEGRLRSVLIAVPKCLHGDKIPGTKGPFNLAVKDEQGAAAGGRSTGDGLGNEARC